METIEHLRELFTFNDWANRRVVNALRISQSETALATLAHLLVAEKEYLAQLYGKDSTELELSKNVSHEKCKELAMQNAEAFFNLLKGFDDEGLDLTFTYQTSDGVQHRNTYREILTHVLFHSMSHRGQINMILRREALEPIANDYIIYLRNA